VSRTSHRWHYRTCPICGHNEKVQNRSHRYVAPNGEVVKLTGYELFHRQMEGKPVWVGDKLAYKATDIHRTTLHRVACARKHDRNPYDSELWA
jgi:hypothetical protein